MAKRLGLAIVLCALLGSLTSCAWLQELLKPPASATYLFIETWTQWNVEVLQGSFGLMIDIPTYSYDVDQQTLDVFPIDPQLTKDRSFIALWGDGISLHVLKGTGGGASSMITGIYGLPFQSSDRSLELLEIKPDGSATVQFQGKDLTLHPGQSWQASTDPEIKRFDTSLIKESFTYSITNFGPWPRAKLHIDTPH